MSSDNMNQFGTSPKSEGLCQLVVDEVTLPRRHRKTEKRVSQQLASGDFPCSKIKEVCVQEDTVEGRRFLSVTCGSLRDIWVVTADRIAGSRMKLFNNAPCW